MRKDVYPHKKTKKGFSLAEVLIVLGLLGVIAVFTIPKIVGGGTAKQHNKVANHAAGLIQSAFSRFQQDKRVAGTTDNQDLTSYMKFVKVDTVTTIDDHPGAPPGFACSDGTKECLLLHNGALLGYTTNVSFGSTESTSAIEFWLDPDAKVTGGSGDDGMSVAFMLYADGRMRTRGTIYTGTCMSSSCPLSAGAWDPSWFSWE